MNSTTDRHNNTTNHLQNHGEEKKAAILFFIFCCCAVGALVRQILQGFKLRLPYTVVLLVLGILFGLLADTYHEVYYYSEVVDTDPQVILHIFLPVLIFEAAFAMEFHTFIKTSVQVVVLAVPGLGLAAFFTCVLSRSLFTYGWNWNEGMMFGSILSATDPVAVVALLREIGASKKFAMVIEGESLLNDGAAIVLYNIFLRLVTSSSVITAGEIAINLLQVAALGPLWGYFMAKVTLFCLSRVFNDALLETTITLASTYMTYYIGEELFKVSGVLAVVVLGVRMSAEKTMISPEVEKFLHRFWETLAYVANTLIFIIVGMVISRKAIFEIHGKDWFFMCSLYFGIFVIRALVIAILSPILRHTGYGMSWQEGVVMTWGGLRGAVSLALALQVSHQKTLDHAVGTRVLIHVSGIVFLTLLINSTTVEPLLKLLGMGNTSAAKMMAMSNSVRFLQDVRKKTLNMLKTDRFLADADWDTVEKSCEIIDPYLTTDEENLKKDILEIRPRTICPDCNAQLPRMFTANELRDITNETVLRMLKAEKMSYWRQFEQGMISREGVRKLQECTDIAADKKGRLVEVEDVKKSWEIPKIYVKLKRFMKRFIAEIVLERPHTSYMRNIYHIIKHPAYIIFVYCIFVLDMANSALSVSSEYVPALRDKSKIFKSLNVVFVSIYILEVVSKMILLKKCHLTFCWKIISWVIVFIGLVDITVHFTLPAIYGNNHRDVHIVLVLFVILRLMRIFRLLEPTMPLFLNLMKLLISQKLSLGYDVGRGYVAGEDEVRKLIDHMVDHKEIAQTLKQISDHGRLDVIRCLGMLQKQHPDIALSIKTRQAIRSVLNSLRNGIHDLLSDGILEESDGYKLEKMVEEMMKRLLNSPPSLPQPPPDKMLSNVFWLSKDQRLIDYIKEKAKLLTYDYEDEIIHEGEAPNGIYIIVSGMVRLESFSLTRDCKGSEKQGDRACNLIDFLTSGNIIGEMGILTKKPRTASVTCETAVQVLFVSLADMETAFIHFKDIDPPLEYRLWHVCANRIATNTLMKHHNYQGWTKEKIKLKLENSYILSTGSLEDNMLTIDSSMCDVILINGYAKDPCTRQEFVGPYYMPWTVIKLELLPDKGPKPIVLIVPSEEIPSGRPSNDYTPGMFNQTIDQFCQPFPSKHNQYEVPNIKKKVHADKHIHGFPGSSLKTQSSPKKEINKGNVVKKLLLVEPHAATSTPGLLEGQDKVHFRPDLDLEEITGSSSRSKSLSNVSLTNSNEVNGQRSGNGNW